MGSCTGWDKVKLPLLSLKVVASLSLVVLMLSFLAPPADELWGFGGLQSWQKKRGWFSVRLISWTCLVLCLGLWFPAGVVAVVGSSWNAWQWMLWAVWTWGLGCADCETVSRAGKSCLCGGKLEEKGRTGGWEEGLKGFNWEEKFAGADSGKEQKVELRE